MMTQTMTGQRWADKWEIEFDWSANGYHTTDGWEHHAYTLTLTNARGDVIELPWKQGMAVDDEPTPTGTLWAISGDVTAGALDWDDFAREFGYDEHDAKLSEYRTWEACREIHAKVYGFCVSQDMFEEFCEIEEGA